MSLPLPPYITPCYARWMTMYGGGGTKGWWKKGKDWQRRDDDRREDTRQVSPTCSSFLQETMHWKIRPTYCKETQEKRHLQHRQKLKCCLALLPWNHDEEQHHTNLSASTSIVPSAAIFSLGTSRPLPPSPSSTGDPPLTTALFSLTTGKGNKKYYGIKSFWKTIQGWHELLSKI